MIPKLGTEAATIANPTTTLARKSNTFTGKILVGTQHTTIKTRRADHATTASHVILSPLSLSVASFSGVPSTSPGSSPVFVPPVLPPCDSATSERERDLEPDLDRERFLTITPLTTKGEKNGACM